MWNYLFWKSTLLWNGKIYILNSTINVIFMSLCSSHCCISIIQFKLCIYFTIQSISYSYFRVFSNILVTSYKWAVDVLNIISFSDSINPWMFHFISLIHFVLYYKINHSKWLTKTRWSNSNITSNIGTNETFWPLRGESQRWNVCKLNSYTLKEVSLHQPNCSYVHLCGHKYLILKQDAIGFDLFYYIYPILLAWCL